MAQKTERLSPRTIWEERWFALESSLGQLRIPGNYNRHPALKSLIEGLEVTAEEHFYDFHNDLFPPDEGEDKETQTETDPNRIRFAADYAMQTVLDRIATDIAIIQRAVDQRRPQSPVRQRLDQADHFSELTLQLAKTIGKVNKDATSPVTYLQKAADTRVIPYATVPLVGIPLTSLEVDRDLLAIPHEIGHYVYWCRPEEESNGKTIAEDLAERLSTELTDEGDGWVLAWVEEIFADVYGCLVKGPVMALDFQDLQLTFSRDQFLDGVDEDHPAPILRPYIYTYILKDIGKLGKYDWGDLGKRLDARWRQKLEGWNFKNIIQVPLTDKANFPLNPAESASSKLPAAVETTIDQVLEILRPAVNVDNWDYVEGDQLEELYDKFTKKHITPEKVPGFPRAKQKTWPTEALKKLFKSNWLKKLRADGWTTKGPHGRM